ITINGGVVTATGGLAAAGIGGGQGSDGGDNAGKGGAGGFITINSGVVTAVGGSSNDGNIVTSFNGAGIGGGSGGVGSLGGTAGAGGDGGTITVNGGTVNASSGVNAAAVGGGQGGSGVLGANGNGGNGGTLVVSGGVLNATGGINAVGIGPGYPSIGTSSTAGNVGDETVVYYSYGTIVSRGEIQAILANFAEMPTGYEYWTSPDFGHDPGSSPGTVFGLGDASLSIPDYGTAFEVSSDDLFTKIIVWRLARVADVTVSGTVGDELPVGQQATLLLCGDTLASGLVDVNASAWFDNLPADLVVLANGSAGQRFITLYFSGIPELEGVTVFDIVIPGSLLASELDLAVMLNPLAVFNIVEAEGGGDNGGDNGNGSDNGNTGTDKPSKPNKPSTPATGDTGYLLLLAMLVLMVLGWLCLHAYGQSQDNTDMALKVVR
ncbi:MAG: hypothetical protein FWH40_06225, partial [Coriobacteriia bacterium]|nr:hypothetical protein [Coriobacteriia bacterium]